LVIILIDQPGLGPEWSFRMEIDFEEGAKPAFRLTPSEMDEFEKQLGLWLENVVARQSVICHLSVPW
jgi:hypothetical protein